MSRRRCSDRYCAKRESTQTRGRTARWVLRISLALSPALCLSFGCAPPGLTEGVHHAAERYGVADASTVPVHRKSYLRFDASLRADLDELLQPEAEPSREEAADLLRAANDLSTQRTRGALDRMPPEGIKWLGAHYGGMTEDNDPGAFREALKKRYSVQARRELDLDLSRLAEARDVRRFLVETRRGLAAAPGDRGRTTRALLAAPLFVPAVIGAEIADAEAMQRTMVADFEQTLEYRPQVASSGESMEDLSTLDQPALAARYTPIFVQQVRPEATYDPTDDRIGRVFLTGKADDIQVNVDTTHPVVYWTHSQARVDRRRYDQFSYVAWYPSRPALSGGDVEAGKIDGVVVRVTLDRHRRPAVYEFVRACGCYHTLWVAEFVEAAARSEFGAPSGEHPFAIQQDTKGRSLFLPALVRDDGTQPRRPLVFVDAGYHLVMAIKPSGPAETDSATAAQQTYTLEPYESLTRLPLGNAVASMFGSDGLVHHAGRQEGFLLAPTGMLSAGQPRQLGTMKIRMDAYDQDDPRLLERNLRFPGGF